MQETLEIIKEGKDEYALKAIGYLNSMDKFSTYFGLKLSKLVFSATEQLSIISQGTDTSLQQAVQAAKLAIAYMERQRSEAAYNLFYSHVLDKSKSLTDQLRLPRQRKLPKRIDSGSTAHQFDNPKLYFKKQYFEVLDVITAELKHRFQQDRGMPIAALLEKTLLDAAKGSFSVYPTELQLYCNDVNNDRLITQLKMLPDLVRTYNEQNPATRIKEITKLSTLCQIMNDVCSSKSLFSEISTLLQIANTFPVTSATAERTFFALQQIKSFLQSTMSQERLNHCMTLHIYKEKTDEIDLMKIAQEFIVANDRRKAYFGTF